MKLFTKLFLAKNAKRFKLFFAFIIFGQLSFAQAIREVCTGYPLENTKEIYNDIVLGTGEEISTFQSDPSSSSVIYLDFDGEYLATSIWSASPILAAPSVLTNAQRLEVCKRVAVDFQPFNVNVTSVRSVFDASKHKQHVIFTPTNYFRPGVGGVAEIGSFNFGFVAWVFSGSVNGSAETASHEIGHTLKLRHDGIIGGDEYYRGHNGWGPIMGSIPNGTKMTQWSAGHYPNANNSQPDIDIISTTLPFRTDDYGSSIFDASPIQSILTDASGNFKGNGLIANAADLDVFLFSVSGGTVNLQFGCDSVDYFNNLRLEAAVYDKNWNKVWSKNTVLMNEVGNVVLTAGTYYLVFDGIGYLTNADGYSDYGSVGNYHFSGKVWNLIDTKDMAVTNIAAMPVITCDENITTKVTVKNNSSVAVNNYTIVISDKNGTLNSVNYSAPLVSGATVVQEIVVTPSYFMDWSFTATVSTAGDVQAINNSKSSGSTSYRHGVMVDLKLPLEVRDYNWNWKIENLNGTELRSKKDFELPGFKAIEIHSFCVPKDSCFNLTVTNPFKSEWCSVELLNKYSTFAKPFDYVWQKGDTASIYDAEDGQGLYIVEVTGWVGFEIMNHIPSYEPQNFTKIICAVPVGVNPEFTFTNKNDGEVLFSGNYSEGKNLFTKQICTSDLLTSVKENTFKPELSIFPNPSNNVIHLAGNFTNTSLDFMIYNAQGLLVKKVQNQTISETIDVSDLKPGVYFLQLFDGNISYSKTFVKL